MFSKVLFSPQYEFRKWQSLFRLQRKATPVSVLVYWTLNPTVGGGAMWDTLYPQLDSADEPCARGSLEQVPVTRFTCLFKQLFGGCELSVRIAVTDLSSCKKQMAMCVPWASALFVLRAQAKELTAADVNVSVFSLRSFYVQINFLKSWYKAQALEGLGFLMYKWVRKLVLSCSLFCLTLLPQGT